jgi:predicted nuclease of predicted toxin-antitoxin system
VSVGFFMDHHVPAAVTRGLRRRNVDVLTAEEDGASKWDDERLLERATRLRRIIFTQDDDLLTIGRDWQVSGREFAGIVYAHQLRITIGQAIRDLELIAKVMAAEEMANRIEFLPIR